MHVQIKEFIVLVSLPVQVNSRVCGFVAPGCRMQLKSPPRMLEEVGDKLGSRELRSM